jgi:hypothetical protein
VRNARWKAFEDRVLDASPFPRHATKAALGLAVAALIGGLTALALIALDAAVGASRAAALFGAVVAIVGAAVAVWRTRFYEFWVPWRYDSRRFSDVYGSVMLALAALTVGTVGVGILIYLAGGIDAIWVPFSEGGRKNHSGPPLTRGGLVALSTEYYVWNFFDGIPVLKVTDSVNWNRDRTFVDHWSGILLLLYKLAVVIPIVALIVRSLRAPDPDVAAAGAPASD